jgi:TonB family protein
MKLDRNDTIALAGTIAFHAAIIILLFFIVLKTVVPVEEEGVLVNFGNVNAAAGIFEPQGRSARVEEITPVPEDIPTPAVAVPTEKEEMVTQDTEETIALADRKKEEERKKREDAERKERERLEAERKRKEEQRRREQAIRDQVAGAFGSGDPGTDSQGDAGEGTGNQGSPFGNADTGASEGTGGMGSFNLEGRSIRGGGLPRPAYNVNVEGRIVIDITVDPKGNVLRAEIGKGTNIDNASIRASALGAARQAKFNSIPGANNQSGTITYRYALK